MTKEQLFEKIDYEEGDGIIIIRIRRDGSRSGVQKTIYNIGVSELLGIYERGHTLMLEYVKKEDQQEVKDLLHQQRKGYL